MVRKKYLLFLLAAVAVAASFVTFLVTKTISDDNGVKPDEYSLLSKRLFVENPNDIRINFSPLRKDLNNYFKQNQISGAMYFEYLPTGTSVRINDGYNFRGASLIKLPVAMELYKAAEQGKIDLDDSVILKKEWLNDDFGTLYQKGEGYELTLREATKILLSESDNTALRVILAATEGKLDEQDLALGSLDIEFEADDQGGIYIGPKAYSSFFKCLYFACYNTKSHSQEILEFLSNTDFNDRIVAGISDKSITISHKVGVFNNQAQGDCGIVYKPDSPYLICIMLNGDNTDSNNKIFADISKKVYGYLAN